MKSRAGCHSVVKIINVGGMNRKISTTWYITQKGLGTSDTNTYGSTFVVYEASSYLLFSQNSCEPDKSQVDEAMIFDLREMTNRHTYHPRAFTES